MNMMHFDPSQGWWPVTRFFPCLQLLQAGNAMNHPERIQADPHTNGGLAFEAVWNIPWYWCVDTWDWRTSPHISKKTSIILLCHFPSGLTKAAENFSQNFCLSRLEARLCHVPCSRMMWATCQMEQLWIEQGMPWTIQMLGHKNPGVWQVRQDRRVRRKPWEIVCGSAAASNSLFQPSWMFQSQYMDNNPIGLLWSKVSVDVGCLSFWHFLNIFFKCDLNTFLWEKTIAKRSVVCLQILRQKRCPHRPMLLTWDTSWMGRRWMLKVIMQCTDDVSAGHNRTCIECSWQFQYVSGKGFTFSCWKNYACNNICHRRERSIKVV